MVEKVKFEDLTDEELDARLADTGSTDYESMSDDELNSLMGESQKEKVKLGFGEKVADFMSGGAISGGKKIQQEAIEGKHGEKAKILAEGLKGGQEVAQTAGEVGQSFLLAGGATKLLSKVPALSKQKVIQGLLSNQKQRATNFGIKISNIQRAVQRNAIEGAVAVQPFDYDSVKERIAATAGGASLGVVAAGTLHGAGNVLKGTGRGIKKLYRKIKDPRIPSPKVVQDEISAITAKVSEVATSSRGQIMAEGAKGSSVASDISGREKSLKESIKRSTKASESLIKSNTEKASNQIKESIDVLDDSLKTESDVAAKSWVSKITGFFRNNSKAYGKELDVISDEIAKTGRMTRAEADDVLNRTIRSSADDAEIVEGSILAKVKELLDKKYGVEIVDQAGDRIIRDGGEVIPFKEFLNDVRDIWKSAKPYKTGARYSKEEIPAAILQSEFGELVSVLPGGENFKVLQGSYRPVISYMNRSNVILKPYKGEAFRDQAYNLIKKFAKGEASPNEKDIVNFIENGTEKFAKGIGSYSARAKQVGVNIKTLKSGMVKNNLSGTTKLLDIAEEGAKKLERLESMGGKARKFLEKEVMKRQAMIAEESARLEMIYQKRLSQLSGRAEDIQKLQVSRAIQKSVSVALTTVVGGLTTAYVVTRGGREVGELINQ